jgi:C-terminal processing protease CtpA/Prc
VCKEGNDTLEMKKDVALRRQAYVEAVATLKGVDTIIIDLRNNGGGDPYAVQLLCSLFIVEERSLNRIERRTKDGTKIEIFNTLSNIELPQKNRLLNQKIYVLIGPKTFSAAEEFSNNMKVLERATIVGEPSAGAANPATSVPIGDDLEMQIPNGRAVNPFQQGNWEGVGIIPDHMVSAGKAFEEVLSLIKSNK